MGDGTKTDEFSGKFQTAFDPYPLPLRMVPFTGNHVHIFHTLLCQFHAVKALFKVPILCNINFWIERDLPP